MNFEIRMFANPAGFEEIRLNLPPKYSLFTDEVVAKRNFDGERGQLPNGTFSVYYTPDAYIIAYHFLLSSEAQFRGNEAHVAVAIRRGFKMLEPTATLQELANEFARIAIEYKQSAAHQIYHNSDKFYAIVSSKIVEDPLQFKFNTTYSASKRAIVAVNSPQERDIILSDPFRPELKEIDILFIIKYEDGPKVVHLTSTGYKPIAIRDLQSPRVYTLVYPDGHRVAFTDINQELPEHTICRKHERPLTYSGSVSANMDKWKITVSDDRSEYIIGLQPQRERKEFTVIACDQKAKIDPALISVTVGHIRNGIWILEGEEIEIASRPRKELFSIAGYQLNPVNPFAKIDESTYCLYASKLYRYDLSEIFKFLKDNAGPNAKVDIRSKTTSLWFQCDYNSRQCELPIPYSEASVRVPETLITEETVLDVNSSGMVSSRLLKKKKTGEITITFAPDCSKELNKKLKNGDVVGTVTYRHALPDRKNIIQKDEPIYSYPIEIKDLPLAKVEIGVAVDGYHVYKEVVNLKNNSNQEVVCYLKPTASKRVKQYSKRYLPSFVVGIILGAFIGLCVANFWGGFLPSYKAMSDKIDSLSVDTSNLRKMLSEAETNHNNATEIITIPGDTGTVSSEVAPPPAGLTAEQQALIDKLKGETFTQADVDKAKTLLQGMGQDALIKDAEACLKILNLTQKEKKLLRDGNGVVYDMDVNKLPYHKASMLNIINNGSYKSTRRNDFKSIQEMKQYLSKQTNP